MTRASAAASAASAAVLAGRDAPRGARSRVRSRAGAPARASIAVYPTRARLARAWRTPPSSLGAASPPRSAARGALISARASASADDSPDSPSPRGRGSSDGDSAPSSPGSTASKSTPSRATNKIRPPERDTGIARERDIGIDFDAEERNEIDDDGSSYFLKSGLDKGEGGYRCRWTVQGRSAKEATWEYRETHWEKTDASGYKELGAEKSGFNEEGDTWWETWKECYVTIADDGAGERDDGPKIERSADKWARDATGKEWHEKWWEMYDSSGRVERGVEKSGRQGIQAWWEKWGEQRDGLGGDSIKWTDKWAENGAGTRWGDKWEERFAADGGGKKVGETWRVGAGGERWSRTWGENIAPDGEVRKYGQSTSGERWDTTDASPTSQQPYYDLTPEYGWEEALEDSERLLAIEPPTEE